MSAKPTPTFYIFHGDESIGLEKAVQDRLKEGDELNTSVFDGTVASVPEVMNAVTSYPFLAEVRIAVVKDMLSHITRKGAGEIGKRGVEQLLTELPLMPAYSRLIFVERSPLSDNDKFVKLAASAANGVVKKFVVPQDLMTWIIQRAKDEYGVEIIQRAANALAEVVSGDLRRADNELCKLVSYVQPGKPITENDVAALTPYVAEANLFTMVDALAAGNGQTAMRLMHRLLQDKDNDAFSIFGMITRQFRLLLLAKEHLAGGGRVDGLASAIKVAPFVAQKLATQSRAFKLTQLEAIYRRIQDYDVQMKTGKIEAKLALDLLVAGLTG